jgi:sterol desaturase/sphingolipid hydroxylase (fatty acid hydroxylase superfamily)
MIELPAWLAILLAVAFLDFAVYAQHVLFHHVPWLWRLHRMHHADLEFDVTTALRFHPLEIMLSMLIKMAVVSLLGASAIAVVIFEVLLNATAMFNHANLRLSDPVDRSLRLAIVTPDMHRVHHSVRREETNSNYGFNLSIWDRLFGTYRAQPQDGHDAMTIGIEQFRSPRDLWIDRMLLQPFAGPASVRQEDYSPSVSETAPMEITP